MSTPKKSVIFVLLTLFLAPQLNAAGLKTGAANLTSADLIAELDSLLLNQDEFVTAKEQRLNRLRDDFFANRDDSRAYWLANDLYEEYCAYDSDSAMVYANRAIDIARDMNRPDLVTDMTLNKAYLFSATGVLNEAEKTLDNINLHELSPRQGVTYCDRQLFLSTHRDQYMDVRRETQMYSMKMDSLLQIYRKVISPDDPRYCWLMGWSSLNSEEHARKAIPLLDSIVNAQNSTTRNYAMNAWVLAKLYERTGDRENYLRYLILSAMADIKASNKEIASLEEISSLMYDRGDYEHANLYLNQCIAYANEYKSRVRIGRIAGLQKKTLDAIHKQMQHQSDLNTIYLIVLALLLAAMICAVIYIMLQNRRLKASREKLSDANNRLSDANANLSAKVTELQNIREELNVANSKLSESYEKTRRTARELAEINETKEEYIASVFSICSNFIFKHEEFRANLQKLLAARKFQQATDLVKSPEISYDDLKELYASFDHVFLQLFPNFVSDFNTLLRPEEQIALKRPDHLTTDLRIYALVRLGLNDSVKIARFLHCSVQTVYNTRQRTRNKAIVSRDEFASRVQSLGKPAL